MTGFHLERVAFDPFAAVRPVVTSSELPARIDRAEFSALGALVAVHCPSDRAPLIRQAGGLWEPGSRHWLMSFVMVDKIIAIDRAQFGQSVGEAADATMLAVNRALAVFLAIG